MQRARINDVKTATRARSRAVRGRAQQIRSVRDRPQAKRLEDVRRLPTPVKSRPAPSPSPLTHFSRVRLRQMGELATLQLGTRNPQKPRLGHRVVLMYSLATLMFVSGMSVTLYTVFVNRDVGERLDSLSDANGAFGVSQVSEVAGVSSAGNDSPSAPSTPDVPSEERPTLDNYFAHTVSPTQPRYIRVPDLSVDARVGRVGLTSEGAVGVPGGIYDVGWYGDSLPSNPAGAMLMVGHYSGPTQQGVFYDLADLKAGSEVEIEQGDGTKHMFKVVETYTYDVADVDMVKAITSADNSKLGLNIITCGGDFDSSSWQYQERTLVRAIKV